MLDVSLEPFMRRHNADGSWESICKCCFFTVATRREQSDLEPVERLHNCQAFALARYAHRSRSAAFEADEV